uniref:beta-fructofuranosidase n=1 Tax=Globodera pallida TaxID=36090 RepID=A0A183BI19_GLOPA
MLEKNKNTTKLVLSVAGTAILTALLLIALWMLTKGGGSGDCSSPDFPSPSPPTPQPISTTTQSPPAPPQKDHFVRVDLRVDSVFHIWFRANSEEKEGIIYGRKAAESDAESVLVSTTESDERWFDFREIVLLHKGEMELSWWSGSTTISYIYVFEPEMVQAEGIRTVYISPDTKRDTRAEKFHFHAPLGWTNDPAGFSRTPDKLFHLFYQHYPHRQQWASMHWGHAVSEDLVNWKHQPIMLRPEKKNWKGGIFTGSAVPTKDGGLRIYYTDHNDDRHPMESQRSVLTKDFYRPMGPPRDAIPHLPAQIAANLTEDFRDPNVVVGPDGALFMTASSRFRDGSGGVVLLFRQNETAANGAPDGVLIPLGDPHSSKTFWALIYSMSNSIDEDGRQNLNPVIVGNFDGEKFKPRFEQMLDFAAGSYAFQGFYDPIDEQSLLIGWLGNWPDYYAGTDRAFPTAYTLPRLLKLAPSRNYLMTPPHPSVIQLRERELDTADFRSFKVAQLPSDGAVEILFEIYYWRLRIYGPIRLEMSLAGKGEEGKISLVASKDGLEMVLGWKNVTEHRYVERKARPTSVQIFIDVGSVEVFSDQGQWTGTTRIPDEGRVDSIQLVGKSEVFNAASAKMWAMKSTQPEQIMP